MQESRREGKKVKSICLAYLGKKRKDAEKKMKEILKNKKEEKSEKVEDKNFELEKKNISVEELSVFCKRKGFVYPSGEIYGGFAGFWDFGPLGVELKNNLKREWWKFFVQSRKDIVGIDGSIITNPRVWEASGHVKSFVDPLVECKKCHHRFKADDIQGDRCPDCGGDLVQRMSKKRRIFYGCSNYPECKFITGFRPLPQPCPQCGKLLTQHGKQAWCVKCDYKGKLEPETEKSAPVV